MIQIPLLVLFNAVYVRSASFWPLIYLFLLYSPLHHHLAGTLSHLQDVGFMLIFSDIHLWASIFSVILVNYIFMDGKCDYFQGMLSFPDTTRGFLLLYQKVCGIFGLPKRDLDCNQLFFAGTALVVVYLILLALYFFAPSPRSCWGSFQEKKNKHTFPSFSDGVLLHMIRKRNRMKKRNSAFMSQWWIDGCFCHQALAIMKMWLMTWNVNVNIFHFRFHCKMWLLDEINALVSEIFPSSASLH